MTAKEPSAEAAAADEGPKKPATERDGSSSTAEGSGDAGEAPRPRRRPRSKSSKSSPTSPRPEPEDVPVPSRQTLLMLGAILGVTLISWGSARSFCNYHPFEVHAPRKQPLSVVTQRPKHTAFEFSHRVMAQEFSVALELSEGQAAEYVQQARARCEADAAQCASERAGKTRIISIAELISQTPQDATARVTHQIGDQTRVFDVGLRREGKSWKAVTYEPAG